MKKEKVEICKKIGKRILEELGKENYYMRERRYGIIGIFDKNKIKEEENEGLLVDCWETEIGPEKVTVQTFDWRDQNISKIVSKVLDEMGFYYEKKDLGFDRWEKTYFKIYDKPIKDKNPGSEDLRKWIEDLRKALNASPEEIWKHTFNLFRDKNENAYEVIKENLLKEFNNEKIYHVSEGDSEIVILDKKGGYIRLSQPHKNQQIYLLRVKNVNPQTKEKVNRFLNNIPYQYEQFVDNPEVQHFRIYGIPK